MKGNPLRTAPTKRGDDNAPSKEENSGVNASNNTLELILESLDDSKAENTISIDIAGKSALGDYMIVTSGRSNRHVSAICDELMRVIKDSGGGTARVEGLSVGDWVLIDAGDIIIHVFRPEIREFYNIEKMWLAPEGSDKTVH